VSRVAAPADRRFRRAHVKPSHRRVNWRPLTGRLALIGAAALALLYGVYRVRPVIARLGTVHEIVVRGNERLSKGEVLSIMSGLRGESLFTSDLDAWRRRVMRSPWVRDAALRRSLPSTVEVMIFERQPVAIARINGETYLVDEAGVVIDQYGPQYADFDLPIVDGLTASPNDDGSSVDAARAELAARVIAAVRPRPELARQLSQIDVADPHNAAVLLSGDPAIVYVGDDQILQRLQSYLQLAPALRQRVPDIDYVDLRFDERIYVRPGGKRGVRPEAAGPRGSTRR
jgi:cell division protein FtsQ